MGIGPVASTKKVMAKTGMTVADMDLVEANEAFAAQSIAVGEALGFDKDKLNVNGGAIALGKTTLRKNNWLNVCKLPDRRLVAGKQAKRSQIQIP